MTMITVGRARRGRWRHWAINIRKFVLRAHSLDELVRLGTMTSACARFLEAAVVAGLNIVVAGATQAGKTTLLIHRQVPLNNLYNRPGQHSCYP